MNISPAAGIAPIVPSEQAQQIAKSSETGGDFSNVLSDVIRGINGEMLQADQAVEDFENGKTTDLNSVVMASVKADLSFRFLIEMRNRATETYQELSRMQF